jgi:hypothetical protein
MEANQEILRHWILSLAIEGSRELSDFVPYVETLYLNVHPVPGAAPHHYAEAFLALFDAGSICCFCKEYGDHGKIKANRSVVESVLEARLQLPQVTSKIHLRMTGPIGSASPDLRWEITDGGGEEWERLAQPNWERYVFVLFDLPAQDGLTKAGDAWSASLDSLMVELGWCGEFNHEEVDRKSIAVEILRDYPIAYWKVLPVVYHATFLCRSVEPQEGDLRTTSEWFHEWWVSRRRWHKAPWELPGWGALLDRED